MKFVPTFKDKHGNRIAIPAKNTIFDTREDAEKYCMADSNIFFLLVLFCLEKDEILELDINDEGKAIIPHVEAQMGQFGTCIIISGPLFEEAKTRHEQETKNES